MAGRSWLLQRPRGAQQGLFGRDPADHPAGLLRAAAHLCDDLRVFQAARLQPVSGRAAALLFGEVEITEAPGLMRGLPLTLVALASLRSVIDFCTAIAVHDIDGAG